MLRESILDRIDWITVLLYVILITLGWLNIYAAVYDEESINSIITFSSNPNKQLLWIATSLLLIIGVMVLDYKFYDDFAYFLFAIIIILLIAVLSIGIIVAGSKSWFQIGEFRLQPSELAKLTTALALAKFFSSDNIKIKQLKNQLIPVAIIGIPILLIILQGDFGSALVFTALFMVLYLEGITPLYFILTISIIILFILSLLISQTVIFISTGGIAIIIIGLSTKNYKRIIVTLISVIFIVGIVKSVDYIMTNVFKPHQKNRIIALINPESDPLDTGWNITQSKIAIGSGGLFGKGFLQGTQTKFDFVPEQSTDFIFCTLGEEHGWVGSLLLISLFTFLLIRISIIAERQKSKFARIYGYGVLSILLFHYAVNIAMTIGLFPVIGIPLPFISYGGSSLWSFTLLLFILIKLDAERMQVLMR